LFLEGRPEGSHGRGPHLWPPELNDDLTGGYWRPYLRIALDPVQLVRQPDLAGEYSRPRARRMQAFVAENFE
jgi:hypothetical protein